MLKKRLVGVVTVKNGWAVQSFGYHRYLPLGKPECLVENLDRWGADEILVQVIDRSIDDHGPDYELLKKLSQLALGTPLIYGGGIRSIEDGVKVIQSGADRIIVDAILHGELSEVKGLYNKLGSQAVIASIPVVMGVNGPEWFNYKSKAIVPFSDSTKKLLEKGLVSEVMLTDVLHEGYPIGFDSALIDSFPYKNIQLIAFGGISNAEQIRELLENPNVAAISVGNFLNYREHAIQQFKEALSSSSLRPPKYTNGFHYA
jgi:imidazole glycerol-phosphate synthase subunit HisF